MEFNILLNYKNQFLSADKKTTRDPDQWLEPHAHV